MLLSGDAWLFERDEAGAVTARKLQSKAVYLVEIGVRHAIILREGASVFIAENRDMDNSVTEPMTPEERQELEAACAD